MHRYRTGWLALAALAVVLGSPPARAAEECVTHYSWKCDDKQPNQCTGGFSDSNQYTYTETSTVPHTLWYVLRFSPPVAGPQYLRMSGVGQHYSDPSDTDEVFQVLWRQADGCDETGRFQVLTTFDGQCCSEVDDYALGTTSSTDICIGVKSTQSDSLRDELLVHHAPNHYHPVIVTKFDDTNCPDSETTNPGTKISGSLANVCVCKPGSYEKFQEGGLHHQLLQVYTIPDVPEGSAQTLHVRGRRPNNEDGDDFDILYKWSSTGSCTGIFVNSGESIDSASWVEHTIDVGNSSGTLCVALDDSTGGYFDDYLFIEHVYVVTTP